MKRVLACFLAVLYLALSSGFSLELHHCMGKIAGVALITGLEQDDAGQHRCNSCGMLKKKNKGCCHDERQTFKTADAAFFAKTVSTAPALYAALPPPPAPVAHLTLQVGQAADRGAYTAHAPPDAGGPPLYLRVCCFRI